MSHNLFLKPNMSSGYLWWSAWLHVQFYLSQEVLDISPACLHILARESWLWISFLTVSNLPSTVCSDAQNDNEICDEALICISRPLSAPEHLEHSLNHSSSKVLPNHLQKSYSTINNQNTRLSLQLSNRKHLCKCISTGTLSKKTWNTNVCPLLSYVFLLAFFLSFFFSKATIMDSAAGHGPVHISRVGKVVF